MMSVKAGKRPLRSLTAHEKLEAIRRVHDGESKASVARDIGVPESTLRGWCKNEEKISYISRQSSPDTDDSIHGTYEPKEKKAKLNEDVSPFNLSLKPSPRLSYSPGAEQKYPIDYMKSDDKPLNLNTKSETPKNQNQMSEREKNRAELARLSIEFGLNRPEMYSSLGGALADLSSNIGLLSQWNNLFMQQQKVSSKKVTAPADTSTNIITSSAPLLTTYNTTKTEKPAEKSPKLSKLEPPKSVEESVWYWLSLAQNQANNLNLPSSTSSTNGLNTTLPPLNSQNNSWWKWYKQYTQVSQQLQQVQQQTTPTSQSQSQLSVETTLPLDQPLSLQTTNLTTNPTTPQLPQTPQPQQQQHHHQPSPQSESQQSQDKQILYQQLTKEKDSNSENLNKPEDRPKVNNNNKARAVLDNLLLNNNNVSENKDTKDEDDLSQSEALEHGEKFLKWLECCSEPSVTAMQIMQFRGLINNIKTGADRKNGDIQKTKVRRK